MKNTILILIFLISSVSHSQLDNNQVKFDSIIKEADLLYNYEKVAWASTDLLMSLERLKNDFGGYIVYHSKDTIYASMLDKSQTKRIIKYSFTADNVNVPFNSDLDNSSLTEKEEKLLRIIKGVKLDLIFVIVQVSEKQGNSFYFSVSTKAILFLFAKCFGGNSINMFPIEIQSNCVWSWFLRDILMFAHHCNFVFSQTLFNLWNFRQRNFLISFQT